jgi:hypothetical protein
MNLDTGVKITQLRLPAPLYERVRERAHEERQSRNQTMVEALGRGLDCREPKEKGSAA